MTDSPAGRQAAIARDVLERVMLDLKKLPGYIDRRLLVGAMEEAMARLVLVVDQPLLAPDHLDRLGLAQRDVTRARVVVEEQVMGTQAERFVKSMRGVEAALAAAREETIEAVVAVQSTDTGPLQAVAPRPFSGSLGCPRLHQIERDPLRTLVDVETIRRGEDQPPDDGERGSREDEDGLTLIEDLNVFPVASEEEDPDFMRVPLKLEVESDKRLQVLAPTEERELDTTIFGIEGEVGHARRLVRDCLEEIGNLGNLRILKDHEKFGENVIRFEQRMLNDLDAVVALAQPFFMTTGAQARYEGLDVLTEVLAYSRGAFTADPVRTFARAFVLSCVEGQDAVRAAVLGLRQSHPLTHHAQTQALSLGTNPGIIGAMKRLCADDDGAMVRVALDVLLLRNDVDYAAAVSLLDHPRDDVRARAARCLGLVDEAEAATAILLELLETEIVDEVIVGAVEGLVLQGSPAGLPHVRERLREELEEPGILTHEARGQLMDVLALCGGAGDAELLGEHVKEVPATASALGWHGHIGHVDTLIELLERPRHELNMKVHEGVARALHRITGAPLQEPRLPTELDYYGVTLDPPMWKLWW